MVEPRITINGKTLDAAQAAVLRVAATNMLTEMADPAALGDDFDGRQITAAYHARLTEIMHMMLVGT